MGAISWSLGDYREPLIHALFAVASEVPSRRHSGMTKQTEAASLNESSNDGKFRFRRERKKTLSFRAGEIQRRSKELKWFSQPILQFSQASGI
jgi:hypothetical protein